MAVCGLVVVSALGTGLLPGWRFGLPGRPALPVVAPPLRPAIAPLSRSATPAPSALPKPGFDAVRVSPHGDVVLAGRAAPGAEVTIRRNGVVLGRVKADDSGQWVFVPDAPLPPGGQQLSLSATSPAGGTVEGDSPALVVVPGAAPAPAGAAPAMAAIVPPMSAPRVVEAPGGSARARLGLGAVDYGRTGAIRFSGRAPPDAMVRLYIDNRPAGDARADRRGDWSMTSAIAVAPGVHRLRVDQLNAAGRVTARVELPFSRAMLPDAEATEAALRHGHVVVQPGESLWRIARQSYGAGIRYTVIYAANRSAIRDPALIYPGQIFAVPGSVSPAAPGVTPASSSTSK